MGFNSAFKGLNKLGTVMCQGCGQTMQFGVFTQPWDFEIINRSTLIIYYTEQ